MDAAINFEGASLKQWQEKINKDLKTISFNDLDWEWMEKNTISAFITAENTPEGATILNHAADNDWRTGFIVPNKTDVDFLSNTVKKALHHGANSIGILENQIPFIDQILNQVDWQFVELNIFVSKEESVQVLFEQLDALCQQKSMDKLAIKGTLFSTFSTTVNEAYKGLKSHGITSNNETPDAQLTDLIAKAKLLLDEANASEVNEKLVFGIRANHHFFLNISKIRALKIIWKNIMAAYNLEIMPPIHFFVEDKNSAIDSEKFIAPNDALMSGIIGGAHTIYIPEFDNEQYLKSYLEAHSIFKMESYMDKVIDPAAGSYLVESLTSKLCDLVWAQLKEMKV